MRVLSMLVTTVLCVCVEASSAGQCQLEVTRVACPSKEEFSFAKCGGQASCRANLSAVDKDHCQRLAMQSCANPRPNVTKSKQIRAMFNGESLTSSNGQFDFCPPPASQNNENTGC